MLTNSTPIRDIADLQRRTRALESVPRSGPVSVSVRTFGAVGDGVTDDTLAIQAALNAVAVTGGYLSFASRQTYFTTADLTYTAAKPISIIGNHAIITRDYASYVDTCTILWINNTASVTTAITADIPQFGTTVTVTSTAGVSMGDMVLIRSTEHYSDAAVQGITTDKGFGSIVANVVDATHFELADPVPYIFTNATFTVEAQFFPRLAPASVVDINLVWTGAYNATTQVQSHGLRVYRRAGLSVENVYAENASQAGLMLDGCVGARVSHFTFVGMAASAEGYGVLVDSTFDSTFEDLDIISARHAVAVSAAGYGAGICGPSWNVRFDNCNLRTRGNQDAVSWDSHCAERCYITNSFLPNGVKVAGGYFFFSNCYISNQADTDREYLFLQRNTAFQRMLSIRNCIIELGVFSASARTLYYYGSVDCADLGDFEFIGNTVKNIGASSNFAVIGGDWYATTLGRWRIENNLFVGLCVGLFNNTLHTGVTVTTPGTLIIRNNIFQQMLLNQIANNVVTTSMWKDYIVEGNRPLAGINDSANSFYMTIAGAYTDENVTVMGNVFSDRVLVRTLTESSGGNGLCKVIIKNNVVVAAPTGANAMTINGNTVLVLDGNIIVKAAGTVGYLVTTTGTLYLGINQWLVSGGTCYSGAPTAYGAGTPVQRGTAAPGTTPDFVGQMFCDTTNSKVYVACGVASSTDWRILN